MSWVQVPLSASEKYFSPVKTHFFNEKLWRAFNQWFKLIYLQFLTKKKEKRIKVNFKLFGLVFFQTVENAERIFGKTMVC